jgi:hypothetical protein
MKIAIIGAGWYGCHIGLSLKNKGVEIDIYEEESQIFTKASSNNQNRLHLGYHYPRSYKTRSQARIGYSKFYSQYNKMCIEVKNNIYAVDNKRSLLDFETYKCIMSCSKLPVDKAIPLDLVDKFSNLSGFISTNEKLIDFNMVKDYFNNQLEEDLIFDTKIKNIKEVEGAIIVNECEYDYVVDCTWGAFGGFYKDKVYFEPCITYLYKKSTSDDFALTIMDGDFISLYPYKDDIYSLTSVKNTPMGNFNNYSAANFLIENMREGEVNSIRKLFEEEVYYYYPGFLDDFHYHSYYTSIKTKKTVNNACREASISKKGREISVLSGKIDTVYFVELDIYDAINLTG